MAEPIVTPGAAALPAGSKEYHLPRVRIAPKLYAQTIKGSLTRHSALVHGLWLNGRENVGQQPVLTQMHQLVETAHAKFVSLLPLNFKRQTNQQRIEIMKRHARDPVLCEHFMHLSGLPNVLIEPSLFERIRNDDPFRAGLIRTLQHLKSAGCCIYLIRRWLSNCPM
jgi:hypothetical protein